MEDLRRAHGVLAEVFANEPEPLPRWDEGNLERLEECRASIEVTAFGVLKYPDLPSAVAETDPHNEETSPDIVIETLARFYASNMAPLAEAIAQLREDPEADSLEELES